MFDSKIVGHIVLFLVAICFGAVLFLFSPPVAASTSDAGRAGAGATVFDSFPGTSYDILPLM